MCFDDDARPPIPVLADTGATGGDVRLTSADGTAVMAYLAEPGREVAAQVVILPDVRGLHSFYRELAMRFAENGRRAIALDYFARTAPDDDRGDTFEYGSHVAAMTQDTFAADLRASLDRIRQGDGESIPIFTVGFCYGGSLSYWAGTLPLGLGGVVGLYGALSNTRGARTRVLDWAGEIRCPVLGLFGGADESIPPDQIDEFRQQLDGAHVPNEIVVYEGAPHSFFDRRLADHADASADAWLRIQQFTAAEPVTV